jgi:uncharacterized protein with HEPN domain
VRSIEIIGEASKKLPEDIKKLHPDIEWRKVAGMRNRLIHDYFGVNYTIVWDVAKNKMPQLKSSLQILLEKIHSRLRVVQPDAETAVPFYIHL